jgi:uncharacterized protein DUF4238
MNATRAHTVPLFYLRGFVTPESKNGLDPFVWLGSLTTGEIKQRSPKNISISRGLYDGPGGFDKPGASIEAHLAKIENAASIAIRKFADTEPQEGATIPPEIWRLLAWQAARTPGWMELTQEWVHEWDPNAEPPVIEPPPEGIDSIREKERGYCLENPDTGERREVMGGGEFKAYWKCGWKWVLRSDDKLELLQMQAWYFQVRHFPRLSWVRLNAPDNEWFITSDRGVAWLADGCADTPPAALRHPMAQVVAPLTRKIALVGRNETQKLLVTPRQVNRFIASAASGWVAGPTKSVVELAMQDRSAGLIH